MHIAAMKPNYLNIEDIPDSKLAEEKEIIAKSFLGVGVIPGLWAVPHHQYHQQRLHHNCSQPGPDGYPIPDPTR